MIRAATPDDATACAALYAPYVTDTAISFETDPPDATEMARRIAAAHAWFVLEDDGHVAGYAYATRFAERAAYRWSCETSIYLERGRRRTGAGRALYETLFERLRDRGFHRAFAGMTLPNEASAGLHRALGFAPAGVYRQVGWKHGAWHDVAWVQKDLGATGGCTSAPAELT
ncbi:MULTISPECIES: GNAT family N-acetyltransferase [unclassified Amycolatopsis]|uniref:GNAT family N-acetyltransferase n=1 Tax=unclassified Amycolatopsis TaxID=2618356 RepID=UPI0028740887|nr:MULTISPECIES: GNAT family N-acetyltransferase [unclassified Amycolatopsis]MDS0139386.1 N-acetyltransferase [Amycolatopsis sp. 505]MDS0149537.1 N-acetyltransferase [Amycolatopsis sp. CM201R]